MTKARDLAVFNAAGVLTSTSNLNATKLTSGTIPNARYGTPTFNGSNLTGIDAGGDNKPAFKVKLSSNQNVTSSPTKLQLSNEIWDTDGKYNTATYRFTPTVAGKYVFSYGTNVGAMNDGSSLFLTVYKNGSAVNEGKLRYQTGSAGSGLYVTGSVIIESDADDYFELYGNANSGNHFDSSMTFFTGFKLAE